MEAFCGSKFWNESYFIHTRHPDFTPCFEKTVLLWVPCLYLWLFFPLEAIFLTKSQDRHIPWSFFNISKIICSSLIFLVGCVHLISNIVISKSENVFAVDFYYPVIFIISVALQMVTLIMEKRRGIQSSAYLFMFWFLLSACGLITFRTSILHIQSGGDEAVSMEIVIFILYYILTLLMFGLNFFADRRPQYLEHPRSKKSCPEEDASFPSRITFSWFTGMVWFGYKQPITQDSLWDLSYRNSSKKITKDWEKHWNKSLQKTYNTVESQTTARYKNKSSNVEMIGSYAEKHHYISILPTMIKSFGVEMLVGAILKLVHDLLQFVSPVLIGLLINYTTDKRENKNNWLGFVYAFCFLVVTQTQSLFLGQYFIRMFNIGLKIRTSIVSAVYQKALRISNFSRKESTVGEIVNLMSVDAQRFMDLTTYVNMIWSAPLQITLCLYFLWQILGPSVLAGLAVMVLLIPVNGFLANKQKILQIQQMKLKDGRVKLINEILNGIKVLKLYAWEPSFEQQVLKVRKEEISVLKKAAYLNTATSFLWTCTPFIVTFFMFMMYVLISEDHKLEPDLVFVSITILNILRMPLTLLPMVIAAVIQAGVSLKRMNRFLNSDELDPNAVTHDKAESDPIRIENGTFAWDKGGSDILSQINLAVPEGSLVAVVGPVGAGKSSLCSAILGEMAKISGRVNVKGSTTFVPQQAWIQNATLEDNILFGKSKEPFFYRKVIDACALKADLDMLPAKEMTEIGEKGINLSGGQKQRVSLARAVYYNSDIYLLDDPLSAVDSHVGRHIFDKVIGPRGMLAGKTRIMVTHNLSYLPKVDHIVVLKNGQITEQGSYRYLMSQKGELQAFLLQYISEETEEEVEELKHELEKSMGREVVKRQISRISRESESSSCDEKMKSNSLPRTDSLRHRKGALGENDVTAHVPKVGEKLIEAEKAETGRVSFNVYKYYMKAVGYVTTILTVLFYALSQAASVGSNLWLSKWSEDDNSTDPAIRDRYLGIYGSLGLLQAISTVLGFGFIARATLVGSKKLHNRLLLSIMRCNSSFFDMTPTGRLVNRFAKDVDTLDILLPMNLRSIILCLLAVIATLAIITYTTPIFIVALLPVLVLYYFIQLMYVRSSRQLKRIESVTRSPIYSHFGETIQGAATIRAYGKEADFIKESQRKVDYNQVSYYPSIVANRWLAIRLELLGNFITFFAALFAVMSDTITGGDVGLSISYALSVTQTLNWLVRMTSDVETNIVAVERIKEYSETEQEAPWDIEEKRPSQEWPSKGVVRFDKFSTRYRQELDLVIKKIDFQIDSMEKVGIVGRTGAGKSSLTLSLFRIIEPAEGQIVIDGMDVAELGLHDLRRNLTIIPQDPVLFSGTLRMNLDPFESFSDRAIWDALEHAHLKEYVTNLPSKLQHDIAEGGENLSVGQRQLVCLARALLRKTKILVLDEATAAVDLETDTLIQETIRREFSDCTVITIAHRLNTIMDSDRVLVMEKGRIKEFDSPSKLLSDTQSSFYSMAKDAGLV